jgi:hypothetical protein
MVCTWGAITDVETTIQQTTTAGVDNPDGADDYEAVV